MAKKSTKKRAPITRESSTEAYLKFAIAWNKADNKTEAAEKAGISVRKATAWASRLRKNKVELKKFPRTSTIDFTEIAKAAKQALRA